MNGFADKLAASGDTGHRQRYPERGFAGARRSHQHGKVAADRKGAYQPSAAGDHGGVRAVLPFDVERRRKLVVDGGLRVRDVPLAPRTRDHRIELKTGLIGRIASPVRRAADGQGGREGQDLRIRQTARHPVADEAHGVVVPAVIALNGGQRRLDRQTADGQNGDARSIVTENPASHCL